MDRGGAYPKGTYGKVADRPALSGTHIDAGERVDGPEWHAGEPIDIIERAVEGLPPDRAYSLGQVPGYCPGDGGRDDMDVEPGKADDCAHRSASGHWRSK